MIALAALFLFVGLLLYAAASDVASLTIPNWLCIALAAAFPIAALLTSVPLSQLGMHALFGFAVLAVGFFLFQANILGGGDAKLLAAVAVWTGYPAFLPFLFWMAVSGGILAASLLAARQVMKQTETNPPFVNRLLKEQNGIPYGVAIMIGGLACAPQIPILSSALTLP